MKILLFGANGKTGIEFVKLALNQKHEVIAYVRRANAINIEHPKLKVIIGKLNESEKIAEAVQQSDVCISTLGGNSLRKHATEIRKGIEYIVSALASQNKNKFIYLSSVGANESRFYMQQPMRFIICNLLLKVPLADHTINENFIKSKLKNWTIVRPGGLNDKALTNNIIHGDHAIILKGNPTISRANVASFMLNQVLSDNYLNKSVWLYE